MSETTLWYGDSLYGKMSVVDTDTHRELRTAGAKGGCQTSVSLSDTLESGAAYTELFHDIITDPQKILVIGGGGCIVPRQFIARHPGCEVDVVEIDPTVAMLARKYFWYDGPIHVIDGLDFVSRCNDRYDLIVVDAYGVNARIPGHLCTTRFFFECERILARSGKVAYNLYNNPTLINTIAHVLGPVSTVREGVNTIVYGGRELHGPCSGRYNPAVSVYRDDMVPEWVRA